MRLPLPAPLLLALAALGVILSATVVPGVFISDDNNYLINVIALRQGRVTVANTEGLSPSRELLAFDPGPWARAVTSTPVASVAPPLYAPIALPFVSLGWRGLVLLNTLAYLLTAAIVFTYTRRYASEDSAPWIAVAAFALGGFAIEYAQGVWPHALSIALCTSGIVAAGKLLDTGRLSMAAAAGFLLALATGIRYQNAAILAAVGGAIVLWGGRRWMASAAYGVAAAVPLAVSAAINYARLGSWNPISKGTGYLSVPLMQGSAGSWSDPLVMTWARLVDFSVRPPLHEVWVVHEPATGAHLMLGETVQKAFLQSAPWAILAFALFVLAWVPTSPFRALQRRQVRLLSLIAFAVLLVFALAGVRRHEGLSFNQRYLLELLPLAAVGFAWALDGLVIRIRFLVAGSVAGAAVVWIVLLSTPDGGFVDTPLWLARQLALLKIPVLLAVALGVLWHRERSRPGNPRLLGLAAGVCLGWGCAVHLMDDVAASHRLRAENLARTHALADVLKDGSALVAYWGNREAVLPLLIDRDIVILDVRADDGKDAPMLIRELLGRGRRVFLLNEGFSSVLLARVTEGLAMVPVARARMQLVELRARAN